MFREGDKALMIHGGANKAGRFLEVAVFVEGGRKGGLWLLEERDGKGWLRFARELRVLLATVGVLEVFGFHSLLSSKPLPIKFTGAGVTGEGS